MAAQYAEDDSGQLEDVQLELELVSSQDFDDGVNSTYVTQVFRDGVGDGDGGSGVGDGDGGSGAGVDGSGDGGDGGCGGMGIDERLATIIDGLPVVISGTKIINDNTEPDIILAGIYDKDEQLMEEELRPVTPLVSSNVSFESIQAPPYSPLIVRASSSRSPSLPGRSEVVCEQAVKPEIRMSGHGRGLGSGLLFGRGRARARRLVLVRGRGRLLVHGRGLLRGRGCVIACGRGLGRRYVRGRNRVAPIFASSSAPNWNVGDRLIEVCATDDVIPDELAMRVHELTRMRDLNMTRRCERQLQRQDEADSIEWEDATVLFDGDESALHFQWSSMGSYVGAREEFRPPHQPGPVVAKENLYDAFRYFWDDSILSHIVQETNRYARQLAARSPRFSNAWYDTNIHEILVLFSFWIMLGIIRMPTIKSCFSQDLLYKVEIFRTLFTKLRYNNLCRALHFVDSSTRTPQSGKLFFLGPLLDHFNSKFKSAYSLSQNICIDESLLLWKGKRSFRFGIKTYELCESDTGYVYSFVVYTGKDAHRSLSTPKSTETVVRLVKPILNRGHSLYLDNWFNSPLLARFLKRNGTDCVGTLRTNRANVPALIGSARLRNGQYVARHSGDVTVLSFQDKRKITVISTWHGGELGVTEAKPGRPSKSKPQAVLDYNKNMGGVDRKDQILEPYLLERKKHNKWYMKLFKRLLNYSILNSRIVFNKSNSTALPFPTQKFRARLVRSIISHHLDKVPKVPDLHPISTSSSSNASDGHWMRHLPDSVKDGLELKILRRRCMWCNLHNIQRDTPFYCSQCRIPLCNIPCFEQYHTQPQ